MDVFLASIIQLYVLYILASHDKKSVFWDTDDFWGHSFLWIKMNTFKRRTILKYLFYDEKLLDYRTLRVPAWSLILKSNFYLNIILFIIAAIFFNEYLSAVQFLSVLFTVSSAIVCLFIIPLIEYVIWRFFIHEDKYIENFIILKLILLYILSQVCSIFIMKFFLYTYSVS